VQSYIDATYLANVHCNRRTRDFTVERFASVDAGILQKGDGLRQIIWGSQKLKQKVKLVYSF